MTAKLYIKASSAWNWYDSGLLQLNNDKATSIILDLRKISADKLNGVKEIGVEYGFTRFGENNYYYWVKFVIDLFYWLKIESY